MSTPITAGMPLSVQNPTVKWVFEPTVMFRSGVVKDVHSQVERCDMLSNLYDTSFCRCLLSASHLENYY